MEDVVRIVSNSDGESLSWALCVLELKKGTGDGGPGNRISLARTCDPQLNLVLLAYEENKHHASILGCIDHVSNTPGVSPLC